MRGNVIRVPNCQRRCVSFVLNECCQMDTRLKTNYSIDYVEESEVKKYFGGI